MKGSAAAAVLLLLGALAVAHGFPSRGAEFSPSIVLTNLGEMGDPCHRMVQNAINTGAKSIKFVPTVHYYGSERHIDKFCIRDESWTCRDISPDNLRRFTDLLASCMKKAVDAGKDIAILAHLDNMAQYTWRNLLQFNPTTKYGGYSYADVVLRPMATAANRVAKRGTQIIFTLQGETGKSVSQYSRQWLGLVSTVRGWIRAGKSLGGSDALISISLNYNKVFGWIEFESITPALISRDMDKAWREQAPKYPMDLPNMKRLYDAIDVIGVSAYPPLYPDFKASDLEVTLQYHDQELRYAGINLRALLRTKKLVISEWGVGGGTQDGNSIAPDVNYVAGFPFFGLWYPYAANKDPWRNPAFANYRRKLYTLTAAWLRRRGGPTYRVDGIYMWNAGSWDAVGVHFMTGGSWSDPQLQALVKSHNAAVR